MKEMIPNMASMILIPSREGFSWEDMANEHVEQEKQKMLLTQMVEMLIPKEAKQKKALEAEKRNKASEVEKPKEASSQKQNIISNKIDNVDDINDMPFTTCNLPDSGRVVKGISFMTSKLYSGGQNDCSSQVTALGSLSSQVNKSMGYVRISARAVSNTGPLDYSFDDINEVPFTTLLSAQIAEW